jgi:hypothetical protein
MDLKKTVTKQSPSLNNQPTTTLPNKPSVEEKVANFFDVDQTGWKRKNIYKTRTYF